MSVNAFRHTVRLSLIIGALIGQPCANGVPAQRPPNASALLPADSARTAWLRINGRAIALEDTAFTDLAFLDPLVRGARVVMLGENTHGAREYNLLKARLVRYLHERLGFDVLAFESDFYQCHVANGQAARVPAIRTLTGCAFGVWHTAGVLHLLEYLRATRTGDRPLQLAGIDVQPIGTNKESRPRFLADAVASTDLQYARTVHSLDSTFLAVYARGARERRAYFHSADGRRMLAAYESLAAYLGARASEAGIARQTARSLAWYIRQQIARTTREYVERRDEGMAENLAFLLDELHPERKIVVWGHNFHLRHDNLAIPPDTAMFPDVRARTMGTWIRGRYGNQVYTIGLYAYEGRAADNAGKAYDVSPAQPGSLEAILRAASRDSALFVDMTIPARQAATEWMFRPVRARYNGTVPLELVPRDQYDGVLVVPRISPRRALPSLAQEPPVAITNVSVISMADSAPLRERTVILRDGRIERIGLAASVRVPPDARVVDGTGRWLIPGLFEMHTHTSKTRASALGLFVAHGVTMIRDQGSEHAEVVRWRDEIRSGTRVGPRMFIAGPYLESRSNIERMRRDPPDARVEPFERARLAIGSPAEARRVVDSLAKLELDHLKVRTVQDRDTYLALGAAADSHDLQLTGHVVTSSPDAFLAAGQDGVDHPFLLPPDSLAEGRRQSLWRELAARDVGVVPTLVVLRESVLRPPEYFAALLNDTTGAVHPLRPYLSAFLILDWREQAQEQSPERRAVYQRFWPWVVNHVREMRAAGVRLMAGTDVGVLNIFPGYSLHQELQFFVDSVGMSPMEALASATRVPAEWMGIADSVGTIEVGKVADLVLLDANPLVDIDNTRRIAAVVLRGRLFDRDALDQLVADVQAMPDIRTNDWRR